MSQALESRSTEMLAVVLDGINRLDETRRELLDLFPSLTDEEVIQTRMSARALGSWSWVIECACDAEMMKRVEAKRGRGNKDVEGKGKLAAINKHAYACGQSASTLYRNAQIYKTFKNVLNGRNNLLEEKGFYEAALRAPEPEVALEMFAQKKDEDTFFSVRDAHREAEKLKRKESFHIVKSVLDGVWERIENGCYTPESVLKCSECGKPVFNLDIEEVKLYMKQLVIDGKAEWRDQGGKTDAARGQPTQLCVPVSTPWGSDYRHGYQPKVEYGDKDEGGDDTDLGL